MVTARSCLRRRTPAKPFQHAGGLEHRQTDDIRVGTVDAPDEDGSPSLDRIGAGFAAPLVGGDIGVDLGVR